MVPAPGKYFIRYFPASYQKVKIQVYVPDNLLDSAGKANGDYIVFDPTGKQAVPAFTNVQRLGIGAPVLEVLRKIIRVTENNRGPSKLPPASKNPSPKQAEQ